jgi:hypothetical protein
MRTLFHTVPQERRKQKRTEQGWRCNGSEITVRKSDTFKIKYCAKTDLADMRIRMYGTLHSLRLLTTRLLRIWRRWK